MTTVAPIGPSSQPWNRPRLADVTLPQPRGPLSEHLLARLVRPIHDIGALPAVAVDPLTDDDVGLALHLLYELHYLGLPDVDEAWEWEPSILRERRRLEADLEAALVEQVGRPPLGSSAADVRAELQRLAATPGPALSGFVAASGTVDQMRELAVHRSAYQLKEADPHTWAIPRLTGRSKVAMVDIQRGEYGDGDPARLHATLFADVMDELDLDSRYGAYLDALPGVTLTTGNLVSMFGLHRRWRAALVGHLALFEMCSVGPMGAYRDALVRLGYEERATRFYEEHVTADERHRVVALDEMVAGLMEDEPFLGGEVIFGARALTAVEGRFASHVLDAWAAGSTSLRIGS